MSDHPPRLLFVCSGNICRSPMAAGIAKRRAADLGFELEVQSAGTLELFDEPADPKAIAVCDEIGVDISDHASQGVTDELVDWADHVLVMEMVHSLYLREFHPQVGEQLLLLGNLGGLMEIRDPIGSWMKFRFRKVRDEIVRCVHTFVDGLAARAP